MSFLIAAVGMVAFSQREIRGGKFPLGDRPDIDSEPLEQCERVFQEQLSALSVADLARSVEIGCHGLSLIK